MTNSGADPIVSFLDVARSGTGKPVWSTHSADLNLNLVVLAGDDAIGEHIITEVDVLLLCIDGEGYIVLDGSRHPVSSGQGLIIPKGTHRAIGATGEGFAYLTCHRRRGGMWPRSR